MRHLEAYAAGGDAHERGEPAQPPATILRHRKEAWLKGWAGASPDLPGCRVTVTDAQIFCASANVTRMRCDGFCSKPIAPGEPVWRGRLLIAINVPSDGGEVRWTILKTRHIELDALAAKQPGGSKPRHFRRDLVVCGPCASQFDRSILPADIPIWSEPHGCVGCGRAVHFNIARQGYIPRFVTCGERDCYRAAKTMAQRQRRGWMLDPAEVSCVRCGGQFTSRRDNALYCSSPCRQAAYRQRRHQAAA